MDQNEHHELTVLKTLANAKKLRVLADLAEVDAAINALMAEIETLGRPILPSVGDVLHAAAADDWAFHRRSLKSQANMQLAQLRARREPVATEAARLSSLEDVLTEAMLKQDSALASKMRKRELDALLLKIAIS